MVIRSFHEQMMLTKDDQHVTSLMGEFTDHTGWLLLPWMTVVLPGLRHLKRINVQTIKTWLPRLYLWEPWEVSTLQHNFKFLMVDLAEKAGRVNGVDATTAHRVFGLLDASSKASFTVTLNFEISLIHIAKDAKRHEPNARREIILVST